MNKGNPLHFVLIGLLMAYFGLSDLDNFSILYNGIALIASASAFIYALVLYSNRN